MESVQTELNLFGLVFPDKETELTELEKKAFDLISLGKENAKAGTYIAGLLGISTRNLIDLVRTLRLKHCDIGSTTNDGYYRFKNQQEYLGFMNKSEIELARRNQVEYAMRFTPMAQKIAIETNQMASIKNGLNIHGLVFPSQEIELTDLEKLLFDLIPLGKENAKAGTYIAGLLGISTRNLTELVRRLRLKHCDVGSTTSDGYYRFLNEQEYLEFMNKYSIEQARRNQVIDAMRLTPMAKSITIEMNGAVK